MWHILIVKPVPSSSTELEKPNIQGEVQTKSDDALKHLEAYLSMWAQCWEQVKELFQRQEKNKSVFSSESYAL